MAIRVLHIIGGLALGGAQVIVRQIAEQSRPDRTEHLVWPLRPANDRIRIKAPIIRLGYPNYDPRKFFAIPRLCKEHRIDVIHAHLSKPIMGALLSGVSKSIPVIVHEHGPVCREGIQYDFYRFMLKRLWPRAAAVIAVSHHIETILTKQIGIAEEKIHLLPNAADLSAFDMFVRDRHAVRMKMNIPPDSVVLGYVGRLSRVKGADLLMDILRELKKESGNFVMLVAGEGQEQAAMKRACEQYDLHANVRFLGFVEDIRPVMAASDIGLVPSRQEPFGIVAIEWMRMRTPVITSGVDGLGEFISHGQTGWVTPENTPQAISRMVHKILANQDTMRTVIDNAYRHTEAFELSSYLDRLETLYQEVLNQP